MEHEKEDLDDCLDFLNDQIDFWINFEWLNVDRLEFTLYDGPTTLSDMILRDLHVYLDYYEQEHRCQHTVNRRSMSP